MATNFKELRAKVQARSAETPAARMSARQYLRFASLTGLAISLLGTPDLLTIPGGITVGFYVLQIGRIVVSTAAMFGLNYYLRYSDSRTQRWLRRQVPSRGKAIRITVNILVAVLTGSLLRVISTTLGYPDSDSWGNSLLASVIFGWVILAIHAFIALTEQAQHLVQENEQFKRDQLQARYESLKQQLSPHFLFNSLSTLSGLIHDEPAAAGQFVEEMSGVYRYLLRHGELTAVPLREELAFLRSYVYLLQMRFGENLRLNLDLPEAIQGRLLPPLALQLLVENAVKHNALTRRQPLTITIGFRAPATLVVRNNRQPRLSPEPSGGVGLSNLTNRIRMLHQQELLVEETALEFCVYVPLPA